MHSIGDSGPRFDLRFTEDSGNTWVAACIVTDVRCFGQLETAFAGTLGIVFESKVARNEDAITLLGTSHARQWRLRNAVLEVKPTYLDRLE